MPAYVLVEVDINDPKEYEVYKSLTPATVEAYGGKFIIRGNPVQVMEGSWNHDRLAMIEFSDKKNCRGMVLFKGVSKSKGNSAKIINCKIFYY